MSDRPISELLVADLRSELEKRGLEKTGTKQVLLERLRQHIIDEGIDPDKLRFLSTRSSGSQMMNTSKTNSSTDGDMVSTIKETISAGEDACAVQTGSKKTSDEVGEYNANAQDVSMSDRFVDDRPARNGVDDSLTDGVGSVNDDDDDDAADVIKPDDIGSDDDEVMAAENVDDSNPAGLDYSVTVGVEDGNSELDRELLSFHSDPSSSVISGDNKLSRASKLTSNPGSATKDVNSEDKDTSGISERMEKTTLGVDIREMTGVWINNIPSSMKAVTLKEMFSKHGTVSVARVVKKMCGSGSKLCGQVTMSTLDEANRSIVALNKKVFDGMTIVCTRADGKTAEELTEEAKQLSKKENIEVPEGLNSTTKKTQREDVQGDKRRLESAAISEKQRLADHAYLERKRHAIMMTERRLRTREVELRRMEARLRELERSNRTKAKEIEVDREILRDARERFSKDRAEQERRGEVKANELRAYEQRLLRAETELRAAQEQQQRYYEAERLRQEKMAYEAEKRAKESGSQRKHRRHDDRSDRSERQNRKSSSSPRRRSGHNRSHNSPSSQSASRRRRTENVVEEEGRHAGHYWEGAQVAERRSGPIQSFPANAVAFEPGHRQSFPASNRAMERDATPPRKIKKGIDYRHSTRYDRDESDNADVDRRSDNGRLEKSTLSTTIPAEGSWTEAPTARPRSMLSSLPIDAQGRNEELAGTCRPNIPFFNPQPVPRFSIDPFTTALMMNEMAAIAARVQATGNPTVAGPVLPMYNNPRYPNPPQLHPTFSPSSQGPSPLDHHRQRHG